MKNNKIYCLDDKSITEVPDHETLYKFSHNIVDHMYVENSLKRKGTFLLLGEYANEFVISQTNYCEYIIYGKEASICKYTNCIDFAITHITIIKSAKMSPLMNCDGLSDDEIFANMIILERYLRSFADTLNNFDSQYECKSVKKAA